MFEQVGFDGQVGDIVARLSAARVDELDDVEVLQLVADAERVISWASAVQAAGVASLAGAHPTAPAVEASADDQLASDEPRRAVVASSTPGFDAEWAVDDLSTALHVTKTRAGYLVAFALGLARLPGTATSLREGLIDVPRAKTLTNGLAELPISVVTAVEHAVLAEAPEWTSGQLRAALSRTLTLIHPEGIRTAHQGAHDRRAVVVYPDPATATATLCATGLDAVDARAAWQALDAAARADQQPGDSRSLDARRADALIALLTGHAPLPDWSSQPDSTDGQFEASNGRICPGTEGSARPGPQVALHLVAPAPAPDGAPQPAWLAGYGWLTPSHAQTLFAHAQLSTTLALTDPATGILHTLIPTSRGRRAGRGSEPSGASPPPATLACATADKVSIAAQVSTADQLSVGIGCAEAGYRPSAALDRLVRARDVTCRFPGCRQPASRADLDHLIPHPEGPTSLTNLWALCRHHHRLKQTDIWTVTATTPAGTHGPVLWTSATGRTYTSTPPPYAQGA